jgi:hypothetical protein
MEKLRRKITPNSQLVISEIRSDKKQITIEHQGGENINLKDIRIIIKVGDEKPTKFDLVIANSKKDGEEPKLTVFEATDKMVIDMDKIIKNEDDGITVNGKPIGVKNNSYDDIGEGFEWKKDTKVEVSVIYKPTKEILSVKKISIKK